MMSAHKQEISAVNILIFVLVLLLGCCQGQLSAQMSKPRSSAAFSGGPRFQAGVASVIITPDVRGKTVYMAGFGHNRVATGVHDDLYARCLAIGAGRKILVLCSADLIGLFSDDVTAIREQFEREAPDATLIVAATHDHEGPDTLGLWGPSDTQSGVDQGYLVWIRGRIAEAAVRAIRDMRAAQVELARDDHPLLGQLQGVDRPPFVKDPFLFALRINTLAGEPIATVVNWSDHPETLARNTAISSDYPHYVREYVEAHGGGMALFFSRAVGKVSPLGNDVALQDPLTGQLAADGTWRKAELLGNTIGELAMRALRSSKRVTPDGLVIRRNNVFVPLQNNRFRLAEALGVLGGRKALFTDGRRDKATQSESVPGRGVVQLPTGRDLQSEVEYVQLLSGTKVVAEFVTIPGEIYPELVNGGVERYPGADYPDAPVERSLTSQMKSRYGFILGLANDELGYLIPKAEWDERPPWLRNAPKPWYGEINSVGSDAAGTVLHALVDLMH